MCLSSIPLSAFGLSVFLPHLMMCVCCCCWCCCWLPYGSYLEYFSSETGQELSCYTQTDKALCLIQSWDGSSPSHPHSTSTEEVKHLLCPVNWDRSSEVKDRHYKAHFVTASELVIGTKFQKYWARAPTQLEHMKSWQEFPGFSGEGKIHGSVLETELSPKQ